MLAGKIIGRVWSAKKLQGLPPGALQFFSGPDAEIRAAADAAEAALLRVAAPAL